MGGATTNDYSDLHGLPSHANSVRWSDDNILAVAAGPTVHIAQPSSLSQANAHVTHEYVDFGPVEVDGGYNSSGNPIHVLRAAISRNNMLNTNYTNPSITTIAWSPPGISPTCSSVLAVVGDDHTLKVYGPAVLGNATWALHEDVGAALKQQLRAANWRAAGDLEEPEVPDDDMPVVPVVKPGRGGRKRKVVEVVKEVEEVEEVEEEEPEAPVTPAAPKKVKPVATTAKAPAAPKAPATPATPTAPAGAAAPPEDDECRALLDLPDDALDSANAFTSAACQAVLAYFQAQRMRGKRGRMPKYKPNENLKFRDAETFPLSIAALVGPMHPVSHTCNSPTRPQVHRHAATIEQLAIDKQTLEEAARETVLTWVREVGPKPDAKPKPKPVNKKPPQPRKTAAARAAAADPSEDGEGEGSRPPSRKSAQRKVSEEELGEEEDPRLGWVKCGLDDPTTGAAAKMANLRNSKEGVVVRRPKASVFDTALPAATVHHRTGLLSITCATWSPLCLASGQQPCSMLLAGTADGWLWAWRRAAPAMYGYGQTPTPHVLVGGVRVTRAGITDVAVALVPNPAPHGDGDHLVVAIGCHDGTVHLMHAPAASMQPNSSPEGPLPTLPLATAHTISRDTTPAPPPGMAGFNWGSLAISSLAMEHNADAAQLSLAIGAARGSVGVYRVSLNAPLEQALGAGRLAVAWEVHGWRMVTGVALAGGGRVVSSGVDGRVHCHRWPSRNDVPAGTIAMLEPCDPPQLRDTSQRATAALAGVVDKHVPCWGVAVAPGGGGVVASLHTHRLYQMHLFKQLQVHKRLFRSRLLLQNLPPQLPPTTAGLLTTPPTRLPATLWELLVCADDAALEAVLHELDTAARGAGELSMRTKALQLEACLRRMRRRVAAAASSTHVKPESNYVADAPSSSAHAPAADDNDRDAIAAADAATMLRYAAQLAAVPEEVALRALQAYRQAPGVAQAAPAALWQSACLSMGELVAMQGGASMLGDNASDVAVALRKRGAGGALQSSIVHGLPVTLQGPLAAARALAEDADGNRVRIPCCSATALVIEGQAALQCGLCERVYAVAPVTVEGCSTACVCCGVQLGGPMYKGQLHMPGLV